MGIIELALAAAVCVLAGCIGYLSERLYKTAEKLGNLESLVKCMERLNRYEYHLSADERQAILEKLEYHIMNHNHN